MKRWIDLFFRTVFLVALVSMVFLVGVAAAQGEEPPPSTNLTVPAAVETYLNLGIIFLVTLGLKSLSGLLKRDLTGYAAAISASIVSAVIFFFNALLSAVPAGSQPVVGAILYLIVTILGSFGTYKVAQALSPNPAMLKAKSTT